MPVFQLLGYCSLPAATFYGAVSMHYELPEEIPLRIYPPWASSLLFRKDRIE